MVYSKLTCLKTYMYMFIYIYGQKFDREGRILLVQLVLNIHVCAWNHIKSEPFFFLNPVFISFKLEILDFCFRYMYVGISEFSMI